MGMLDHAEQRPVLLFAIDDPVGIEDLVPAVLRIGLREHGQLGIGRIPPEDRVGPRKVVDLIFGEGEAEPAVGGAQGGVRIDAEGNGLQRARRHMREQRVGALFRVQHGLRHPVMQQGCERLPLGRGKRAPHRKRIGRATHDAASHGQTALARDVGGL